MVTKLLTKPFFQSIGHSLEICTYFSNGYFYEYNDGVNIPKMIIENINGKVNKDVIGKYEVDTYMMKSNEIKIMGRHHDLR